VIFAYLGNGLQLFIVGSIIAWMPSFLNRQYGLPLDARARWRRSSCCSPVSG
jgi:hypothetical protein